MTQALLGLLALVAVALFSLGGLTLSGAAYLARDQRLVESARRAAPLAFLAALVAFGAMEWALLSNDFTLRYVADHHSIHNPLWVTLVTPWSALSGSILLWGTLQTLYTYLVSRRVGRSLDPWRAPVALGVLYTIQLFFFGLMLLVVHPFATLANPPADGPGPNPLLQNNWMMAVHPVIMYLGFVGLSVPFAYAVSAIVTRRYQSWVQETRWWTLVTWGFLTAAIFAGMWWSYEVLGWGGYWAWDPVENASFIPWLLATAFIHTAQVQERKGMFRLWNFSFIILAFAATIFGTFLTRSGIIESVHAFSNGPVGGVLLGFLLLVLLVSFGLLSRVASELQELGEIRWFRREGALLAGSILFVTMATAVLLGTLWPLVVEALQGAKVSVGAPFFNEITIPLGILILLLMGLGPLLPWRDDPGLKRKLAWMGGALLVVSLLGLLHGWTLGASLAAGLFAYNLVSVGLMIQGGLRERGRVLGESPWQALQALARNNRRRFGSHIVHIGIALAALSIAFSQTYRTEAARTLQVGQTWKTLGVALTLKPLVTQQIGSRTVVTAPVEVQPLSGAALGAGGLYQTSLNFYPTMSAALASPGLRYGPLNNYYLVLDDYDTATGRWATLHLIVTPMVLWLWLSSFIILAGIVYSAWPTGEQAPRRVSQALG
jgi:cytochrome c-type biogenesis protein CcmF